MAGAYLAGAPSPAMPMAPRRGVTLSLGEDVIESSAGPGENRVFFSGLATPVNLARPDMSMSMEMGTASFHGSGATSAVAAARLSSAHRQTQAHGMVAMSPSSAAMRPHTSGGFVPQSPARSLRQPGMFQSSSNGRGNVTSPWGPEIAGALSAPVLTRPRTSPAPMTPTQRGFQVAALGGDGLQFGALSEAHYLATPTNSQRHQMMPRSIRSTRSMVLASRSSEVGCGSPGSNDGVPAAAVFAAAPPEFPASAHAAADLHRASAAVPSVPSTPTARRAPVALSSEVAQMAPCWQSGPLATPTNCDRRDTQMSLQMGMPAFRGSASTPTAVIIHKMAPGSTLASGAPVSRQTPSGSM
ncbi:unnamed protein product [Polarella glacialis]|uniref:Uncharacterized protein n=1 Tax=Polarella glacialis TaxID=89957 RepID=A0A813JA71_POLGL|nr:unnamed protein product [Polarella glacialis]